MKGACDTTAFWKSVITNETHSVFTGVDLGYGDYWAAQCFDCHWTGSSKDCDGGIAICILGEVAEGFLLSIYYQKTIF